MKSVIESKGGTLPRKRLSLGNGPAQGVVELTEEEEAEETEAEEAEAAAAPAATPKKRKAHATAAVDQEEAAAKAEKAAAAANEALAAAKAAAEAAGMKYTGRAGQAKWRA